MVLPLLIPLPESITATREHFRLTPEVVIASDEGARATAEHLQKRLITATGYPFPIVPVGQVRPALVLQMAADEADLGAEGYRMEVSAGAVHLRAGDPRGLFHAVQTLLQLLPPEIDAPGVIPGVDWRIPGVHIVDRPRFSWRGFMLDEGRHFHGMQTVLRLLDVMAMLKLNVFHWHLTEDQGWRIAIDGYPRLTEVGAQRAGTARGLFDMLRGQHDGQPHGGFYTHEQIREVVAYAAERHITIVPEIEMPGHSMAALAAYPELSCSGGPFRVPTRFGIFNDIYCAGKESTFTFLEAVLDQVLALFPGPYIHIGGDETPKARWKKCPDCRRRMAEEGLANPEELQAYFTNRMAEFLARRGRTMVGWNEVLSPGLHADAVVQYWVRNRQAVVEAARHGRKTIISPFFDYYLDHSYSLTPLSRTYRHEPVFAELSAAEAEAILGVEASLWSEFVPNRARLDYQAFPRLVAVAETAWTPKEHKDLASFTERWQQFRCRLDLLGIASAPAAALEPSWLAQKLGLLTLVRPQRQTA